MYYYHRYLKYKKKYLNIKKIQQGGGKSDNQLDKERFTRFWETFHRYAKTVKNENWKGCKCCDKYYKESKGAKFIQNLPNKQEFIKTYKKIYYKMWDVITQKANSLYFGDDSTSDILRYAFFMGHKHVNNIINNPVKMAKWAHNMYPKLCSGKIKEYPFGYSAIDFPDGL